MNDQRATVLAAGTLARYPSGCGACGTTQLGGPVVLPSRNLAAV